MAEVQEVVQLGIKPIQSDLWVRYSSIDKQGRSDSIRYWYYGTEI